MISVPLLLLLAVSAPSNEPLKNGGFESAVPAAEWKLDPASRADVEIALDTSTMKEGKQSLRISASTPARMQLEQETYLPVGTLWRLTAWIKVALLDHARDAPRIEIDTPSGSQGASPPLSASSTDWQHAEILFRVPSPGRVTVRLDGLDRSKGTVWFDGIRLDPMPETAAPGELVHIRATRISERPIDIKQGGQFIEPLCGLTPSLIAQQVSSTNFEPAPHWKFGYKKEVDQPFRPWYPDGAVQDAIYSLDRDHAFNGDAAQKIEIPLANVSAGISQDGFYVEQGHSYRLRLHARAKGNVQIRASLHGDGAILAGPVALGAATAEWHADSATLTARQASRNATLTISFTGPGTLWLDRVYLIDDQAILGLWRPDVVAALQELKPGIIRFGGSSLEFFEWEKAIGNWDDRVPFETKPWGGVDPNFVGVEEFVQLCRYVGAEPLICVRWTGKKPSDAAAEVEYFNGSTKTPWGKLRAKNGHAEPYRVKYWQIGNEIDDRSYDASIRPFGDAMKKEDSSIQLLSSFPTSQTLQIDGGDLSYLCPHQYSVGDLSGTNQELQNLREQIRRDAKNRDVRLAVTEWNTTGGAWGLPRGMLLTLGNALGCARYQNLLHRNSDLVEIAARSNLSDSFGSGILQPGPGWLYLTPTYYGQQLYQRAAGSFPLQVDRSNPLSTYLQEPDLSAVVSGDEKMLRIYAVNSTPVARSIHFDLDSSLPAVRAGKEFVLSSRREINDSEAMNSRDNPNRVSVSSSPSRIAGRSFQAVFPPFSIELLELELAH